MMGRRLSFTKMVASGNDFIVCEDAPYSLGDHAPFLCDRHYGIGADQLLLVSSRPPYHVRIYNADGSEAQQCGNGLRSLAAYLFERHADFEEITLWVGGNPHVCRREKDHVVVHLGHPQLMTVPLETDVLAKNNLLKNPFLYVNAGNPHLVLWAESQNKTLLSDVGPLLEKSIPGGVNVHVAVRTSRHQIDVRHWERGTGITLACGSGAIATCFAGHTLGLLDDVVQVSFQGDQVDVMRDPQGYSLKGKARIVFRGDIKLP